MSKSISEMNKAAKKKAQNLDAAKKKMLKKRLLIIAGAVVFCSFAVFFITRAGRNPDRGITARGDIVQISERMFVNHINDIYINTRNYIGKTIKYEGIFMSDQYYGEDDLFYSVFRFGPGGCCGIDGRVGFEVRWPSGQSRQFPADDAWVEITGVLKEYEHSFTKYLYIELTSVNELSSRGREFVSQ